VWHLHVFKMAFTWIFRPLHLDGPRGFFGFCGSGGWTQDLTLARKALNHLNYSTSPFTHWLFFIGSALCPTGLNDDPPICASPYSWDDRNTPLYPAIGWDGGLPNFLSELTLNCDPPELCLPTS
jgi:hypothetical protein